MSKINLETWEDVRIWCDKYGTVPPTVVEKINSGLYPRDAFSLGQLASKFWLLNCLEVQEVPQHATWAILGCWIGSLVPFICKKQAVERIYGFDMDPVAITKAEMFNDRYLDGWKFKGVVQDLEYLDTGNMEFQTGGELIQVTPNIVINTSCEHMNTHWFDSASSDQLIIMQTNNSEEFDGHINVCYNVEQMQERYPMSNCLYAGEMVTPVYSRFMQIGYK